MKKRIKFLSVISLIMSFVMLCLSLSTTASALTTIQNKLSSSDAIIEVENRREEYVKHFQLPNGSIQAVSYGMPVHRKDAAGNWQDINNTLSLRTVKDVDFFATEDLRVMFAKSYVPNQQIFSLNENGYNISMSFVNDQIVAESSLSQESSDTRIQNAPEREKSWSTIEEARIVDNTSTAKYTNIKNNTDLEYILEGNDIKENIIVKSPADSYIYKFDFTVTGLTAILNTNGSISFLNSTENEEYFIPTPYMYDANGEISEEVYFTLSEKSDGAYRISIIADSNWINATNRVFPVTIDPSIQSNIVDDTYISSISPTTNYGTSTMLYVASNYITFIKPMTPSLPENATASSATLNLAYFFPTNITSGSISIGAYAVQNNWIENSLTWSGANQYNNMGLSETSISTTTLSGSQGATETSPKWAEINITSWLTALELGASNYGIALKYQSGTISTARFKSWESSTNYRAYTTITYTEPPIEDGIYKIKNYNSGLCVDTYNDGTTSGTIIQQATDTTNTIVDDGQYFEIKFLQMYGTLNYYSIRPMTNSNMGLTASYASSSNPVTISSMSQSATSITYNQRWAISVSASGQYYTISNGPPATVRYLSAPSEASGVQLSTFSTTDENSYWTFERFGGCKEYKSISTEDDEASTVNCLKYAFWQFDNTTTWMTGEQRNEILTNCSSSNNALYGYTYSGYEINGVKDLLEENWLNPTFGINGWEEVESSLGGEDIVLNYNQWLVAFRVGYHVGHLDYHFWYRTNTGQWAHKQGSSSSASSLLNDLPSNNYSIGWTFNNIVGFYNSDVIYYIITE